MRLLKAVLLPWCFLAALALPPASATGQPIELPEAWYGTTFVKNEIAYSGGLPAGCSMHFKSLVRDNAYRAGAPAFVMGSFGFIKGASSVGGYVKLTIEDMDMSSGRLQQIAALPATAHIVTQSALSTAGAVTGTRTSDQRYRFSVVELGRMLDITLEAAKTGIVTATVARKAGGLDLAAPIDLSVVAMTENGQRTRDPRELQSFLTCIGLVVR